MKCPHCGSDRVYHSRARSTRDRTLKRLLPVTFYRCHDCDWRRGRLKGGGKAIARHAFSAASDFGSAGLVLFFIAVIIAGALLVMLILLGIPMPWNF